MGYYDDVLEHHGILGQKWGVRRFENKNGHLTAAGLKRYEDGRKVTEKEKHAFSAKAAGYKAVAGLHNINSKNPFVSKAGRNLANAGAKVANKQAEKAQKEADAKKAEKDANKKGLTDKQKKLIIAGAAVAGTALAAYGGYKLYQLNKQATEGLSSDLRATANNKLGEAHRLTKQSGAKLSAYDSEGAYRDLKNATRLREEGGRMLRKANTNNFSISEKVNYLKNQKDSKLGSQTQLEKVKQQYTKDKQKWDRGSQNTPPPLPTSHSKAGVAATNKLASDASVLARSVTMTGPIKTSSKPAQNGGQTRPQSSAQQLKANRVSNNTMSSGSNTVSRNMKIQGQKTFADASKANDDLVQELLKKNTIRF